MARTPLQLDPSKQIYGGDPGSAGYQGNTGQKVGSAVGGALGTLGGPGGAAIGSAIGNVLGLIGDLIGAGSGARDPVAEKLKPQMSTRGADGSTLASGLSDPGASPSPGMGPNVRLQAAANLGRRLG